METRNKELEINLVDLLYYLKKYTWVIAAVLVISSLLGALYTTFFVVDTYTATTRMYILNRSSDSYISYSDYYASTYMISDYEVLVTGQNVTEEVILQLDLDMTSAELKNIITVSAVNNTRVLQISVVDTDPQRATDIANCVREIASTQLKEIVNVEAVNLVYEAKVPQQKSGPSLLKNTVLSAILGLTLCLGVLVVIYVLDDTIRSEDDVERHLGLSVLGVIPDSNELSSSKKVSGITRKVDKKPSANLRTTHK